MAEIKNGLYSIDWISFETLSSVELGTSHIVREKLVRPDQTPVTLTTVTASDKSKYSILIDDRFLTKGIVTEPGGLLIDQAATKKYWDDQTPGLNPESFLESEGIPLNSVGIPASNSLWQLGGFFIKEGKILKMPNDESLTGNFETIAIGDYGWYETGIDLIDGQATEGMEKIKIGLSMPMIIRGDIPVSQDEIAARGDLRALADLRNFFDFSAGKSGQPDFDFRFYDLVRKFQPTNADEITQLLDSGSVDYEIDADPDLVAGFSQVIVRNGLNEHWSVETTDENKANVKAKGPFPHNRIPVIGIGHNAEGNLVVTVIDGRQPGSTGATFDELANVMKSKGVINAGIGAAGGDAVVIANTAGGTEILSSPSNKDNEGKRITRPAPSLLIIS